MQFLFTDGCNPDFIQLCGLLDDYLNEIAGGEENRTHYIPYNTRDAIQDVVIAYADNHPIGCAGFKLLDADTAEVKRVFLKKEYRGQGIATQLMRLLENRAQEKGIGKLVLESGEPLAEAMGLYRKIGYSIIKNYGPYKNLSDSICMQKVLTSRLFEETFVIRQ